MFTLTRLAIPLLVFRDALLVVTAVTNVWRLGIESVVIVTAQHLFGKSENKMTQHGKNCCSICRNKL